MDFNNIYYLIVHRFIYFPHPFELSIRKLIYILQFILNICLAYTPGWNDPPSYSFEDTVNAQHENRPKIFDRIPARVFPNAPSVQSKNNQISLDNNEICDDTLKVPAVSSTVLCDIPVEERLSYVMTSLNDSIKNSTLPDVSGKI